MVAALQPVEDESVAHIPAALWAFRGAPPTMDRSHRHDDLEVNVVTAGRLSYLFGGERVEVVAGEAAVFWGAVPHRLDDERSSGDVSWLHVPLPTVLGWGLQASDLGRVLDTRPLIAAAGDVAADLAGRMASWAGELDDEAAAPIALLEAQALVRRLLVRCPGAGRPAASIEGARAARVGLMARHILQHADQPLTVEDVARAAHVSQTAAMTMFREVLGTTIGAYLQRCRIAEARRLLATTGMPVARVALAAGFGSQSAFYEQFTRACGAPPAAYRRALSAASA